MWWLCSQALAENTVEQGMLLAGGSSGFLMLMDLQLLYRYTYGKENVCREGWLGFFFPS